MSLNERHDMPRGPRYAQDNAGRQSTPTRLEPADDISRPARLLADGQDEEYREQNWHHQYWKLRISNGFSDQRIRKYVANMVAASAGISDVPELVSDPLGVEDVLHSS